MPHFGKIGFFWKFEMADYSAHFHEKCIPQNEIDFFWKFEMADYSSRFHEKSIPQNE